jgi:hypothetical protein
MIDRITTVIPNNFFIIGSILIITLKNRVCFKVNKNQIHSYYLKGNRLGTNIDSKETSSKLT